jgi:hypothetical protein
MIGRRGVGAYPGDLCYDPNRPSWLPYWITDFTEANCSIGAAAPPTYPAPPKSGGPVQFSSTPTSSASVYAGTDASGNPVYVTPPDPGQSVADWKVEITDWFAKQAGGISCDTFLDRITPGGGCTLTLTDWLIIAGIAAGGLFVFGKAMR